MPELPEVETVARELDRAISGQKILAVKTSWPKIFSRSPGGFTRTRRELLGKTIQKVARSGKRIFIYLSPHLPENSRGSATGMNGHHRNPHRMVQYPNGKWGGLSGDVIWVTHLKMTGLFLYQPRHSYILKNVRMSWGKHVRAEFKLSRGMLYFSDIRKFGRMIVGKREVILKHKDIVSLAPDPFQISLDRLKAALQKRTIPIKQALLDQKVIAGIGNIYADEILWAAKIHPLLVARNINEKNIKNIIAHARRILKKSIKYGGTSMRDFKNIKGVKGGYLAFCKVYGREGKSCKRNCGDTINRIVIGSRSTRFCPKCQR
ncbi:MAG: bifunctional DNA-formamidopyrimidine glycosylase/DNA-(apurinic or apyrimidinic site) lyase [bacterium]|nr:bifunctional DNA-formamidopyrimidine glycosylase/DNA-(apurinic or apyrimidinic site) lyase [bacterium]